MRTVSFSPFITFFRIHVRNIVITGYVSAYFKKFLSRITVMSLGIRVQIKILYYMVHII